MNTAPHSISSSCSNHHYEENHQKHSNTNNRYHQWSGRNHGDASTAIAAAMFAFPLHQDTSIDPDSLISDQVSRIDDADQLTVDISPPNNHVFYPLHLYFWRILCFINLAYHDLIYTGQAILRFFVLATLYGPLMLGFPIWFAMERECIDRIDATPRMWWINWLVWTIEISGPTFIKLGQWASSRSDLFPSFLCLALSKLQSNVQPHSMEHTINMIEKSFGASIDDLFIRFDHVPIGCGSVAQVYYAELRDPDQTSPAINQSDSSSLSSKVSDTVVTNGGRGKPYAVKVLHPKVRELISLDLSIMAIGASLITFIFPSAEWLSLPEEVATFGSMMTAQLDLTNEASNLQVFQNNFNSWGSVGFPSPIKQRVSPEVLVEDYIEAVPMTKVLEFGGGQFDRELAKIGLTCFLKMLILDNFVHADMHPGNIMMTFYKEAASKSKLEFIDSHYIQRLKKTTNETEWKAILSELKAKNYAPFLYIVDAGLISSLSQAHLVNFIDLFQAISEFNGRRISELMISRSKSPYTVIDAAGFQSAMLQFIQEVKEQTFALENIHVADILGFVLSKVRVHHVKIEGDFVNVAVSCMLLEGMGQRLDASMDLLHASVPFLKQAISQRLDGHVSFSETSFWNLFRGFVISYIGMGKS
ncbi:hypothetical protein BDV3_001015 [Batrachochytrium dendrobatidis]